MASDEGEDPGVLLLVHQLPVDLEEPHEGRLAHLLAPLHRPTPPPPPPPSPFRPPPPPQAVACVEPRLSFRGWLGAPRHWDLWVAKLRPLHAPLWRRLGIHDAVLASTCRFKRDATALLHLASFWSPATSTFAFPWGEATITLHDLASLAGLPADGAPIPAPLPPQWRPDDAALNGVRLGFNRSACKKAHHSAWVKHFLTDHHEPLLEHAAFLALWLTRFVLPGHPESTMRQALFPVAVRLAHGDRLALAPAVLASLYRDLRDIKAFLLAATAAATTGDADALSSSLPLYAPLYILQLWMWERFPALRPTRDAPAPLRDGEPMAARWHDLSRKLNPALIRDTLTSGATFVWRLPYSASLTGFSGWVCNSDLQGNEELRLLAYSLRPCELVGMDCIEQYLPHHVARQFGLDQDVPADVRRANQDWEAAWHTYELKGKNVTFFIPQSEPGVTARYALWWSQQLPPSHLHAGAPSIPAPEWKSSKRKVKKTQVAMEAEAEKERKAKKARVSPATDKKRKLEELYDPKLPGWLAAGRTGISDASGGSCKAGSSSPNYDMGSDEALLPNIGGTNDDVVLLVPRVQIPSPAVIMPEHYDAMNPATVDRGNFVVDEPPGIPSDEHIGGVVATLVEEKPNMPADSSLDTTDTPEEGATAVIEMEKEAVEKHIVPADRPLDLTDRTEEGATVVMELEKEASGVSDRPEEVTAPVIGEKEEKAAIEGDICFTEMNPLENNKDIVTKADECNKVSEEAGSTAVESIEAVQQNQQDVNAGGINNSHDAVPLTEEALSIQYASNSGECSNVSCIMEDSNVAGSMGTNDGETICRDFVDEDKREVSCVEEIGEHNQMDEKDSKEKSQEAPHTEIVDYVEATVLIGTDNDSDQRGLPPTVEKVVISDSTDATLLGVGVPEVEHVEMDKDHNLAKKDAEDMPLEVKDEEAAEQVQINALARDSTEEDKEFAEVDHTDMADPKMHSNSNTETPDKAAEVERAEIDGAKGLTRRDTDGNIGDVPEVGYTNVKEVRRLIMNVSDEKHGEVSQGEHAEVKDAKDLMQEHANDKFEEIPELENPGLEETHGRKEEHFDDNLNKVHDGNTEEKKADEHETDGHRLEGILQVNLLTRDEASLVKEDVEDNTATIPQVEHENLRDELPVDEGTEEKPCAEGNDRPEKGLDESKEVYNVKQQEEEGSNVLMEKDDTNVTDVLGVEQAAEGQGKTFAEKGIHDHDEEITQVEQVDGQSGRLTRIGIKEISEEITREQEAEFDSDLVEAPKDSTNGEMLCSSTKPQLKDQVEVSEESMMEEKCIQDGELRNQRETSSDAVAMNTEDVYDHKTLDIHQESVLKQKQDRITICENMEAAISEISHMQYSGVKSNLVTLVVDETHAAGGNQNLEILDLDRKRAMEESQDVGTTDNSETKLPEDADSLTCSEDQTDPICTEANELELTKGMQNHELLDDKEQQLMEETQDAGTTIENSGMDLPEDSDILVCSENQVDLTYTKVNGVESTKRTPVILDNKEKLAIEETQHLGIRTQNKKANVPEDADTLVCGEHQIGPNELCGGGVDTYADGVNFNDSSQNKEACSKEAREDKEHHGIEHENKIMILENTSVINSDALKSDVLGIDMAGSTEGTDLCALSMEKEVAVQEKQDQEMADEGNQDTNRDVANIDALERGGVKPDEAMEMFHETLHATRSIDVVGPKICPDNKQRGRAFEEHSVTGVVGSETNRTAKMEPEGALPSEPENLFEVEQEKMENEPERSIFRGSDDVSCKDQSSAEVMTAPSNMDDRGEDDNEWAESTKGYDKLASHSINTSCHRPTKFCGPSNEEVKRSQNMKSMYLKDIKESLGRIRAEPSSRVQITSVGYNNPRHAVQEPISACKEIKVPLRDSARDFVRDRAPDLAVISPAEETSRWRQEQYALQILEDVQNARIAEKTRMEMDIRILKAQIAGMERQVMNLDNFYEAKSRSRRH